MQDEAQLYFAVEIAMLVAAIGFSLLVVIGKFGPLVL
jgi:hypothetical protein